MAAPLRARAVVALARLGHPDFDLVAARLLTDVTASVRQAALEALVHRGDRAHAALALVKVRGGDEDPSVTVAAMNALVTLAPAWGIAELREILAGGAADRIELAAVALGGSRSDEALTALVDARARRPAHNPPGASRLLRGIGCCTAATARSKSSSPSSPNAATTTHAPPSPRSPRAASSPASPPASAPPPPPTTAPPPSTPPSAASSARARTRLASQHCLRNR